MTIRKHLCVIGFGACWLTLMPPLQAWAQGHAAQSSDLQLRRVRITSNAGAPGVSELDALLFEWFSSSAPQLRLGRIETSSRLDVMTPTQERDLLRIWLILQSPTQVRVYFADPAGRRFFMRDVPLRTGLDEVGREQLAQVLVTSALAFIDQRVDTNAEVVERALQASQSNATTTQREPASRATPASASVQSSRWLPSVGVYYLVDFEHSGLWRHGPGLLMGLTHSTQLLQTTVNLRAHYLWKSSIVGPDLVLPTQTLATRSTIGVAMPALGARLGVALGLAVDVVHYDPQAKLNSSVAVRGGAQQYRWGGFLGAQVAQYWGVIQPAFLVGATVYARHTEYDILRDAVRQIEYAPLRVQPELAAEIWWP